MPKRSRTKDENEIAHSGLEEIIKRDTLRDATNTNGHEKNAAAVALGRLGGKKGGPARARRLSAERRTEIAVQAARTRWAKKRKQTKSKS